MNYLKHSAVIALTTILAACAHGSIEQQLDQKLAGEKDIQTRENLSDAAAQEIEKDKKLSPDQRAQLKQLRKDIFAAEDAIWKNQLRLRAVLVKDLLDSGNNAAEVDAIQRRMRALNDKRMTIQFEAIDRANRILGRQFEDIEIYNQVLDQPPGRY